MRHNLFLSSIRFEKTPNSRLFLKECLLRLLLYHYRKRGKCFFQFSCCNSQNNLHIAQSMEMSCSFSKFLDIFRYLYPHIDYYKFEFKSTTKLLKISVSDKRLRLNAAFWRPKFLEKIKVGNFITRSPTFSILRLGKCSVKIGCIIPSHR